MFFEIMSIWPSSIGVGLQNLSEWCNSTYGLKMMLVRKRLFTLFMIFNLKNFNSSITLEELMKRIDKWEKEEK